MAKTKKGLGNMDAMSGVRVIGERLIQDPYLTDREFQLLRRVRSGPNVGKVAAHVNLIGLIGGLARIADVTEVQEEAAARYRRAWDAAQLGGARAVDYAQVRVDGAGFGSLDVESFGASARAEYSAAARYLGLMRSSLVERVVVHDQSIRSIAGAGRRAQVRTRDELLAALDDLAVHFGLAVRKSS